MKPTSSTSFNPKTLDLFERAIVHSGRGPVTDYNYHSVAFEGSSFYGLQLPAPPLWNIASDYFKDEARHDFWCEATLFGLIAITAALPLMSNVHALIEFVCAISAH